MLFIFTSAKLSALPPFDNIFVGKLMEHGPNKWTVRQTEISPDCQTQRLVTSSLKSRWRPGTNNKRLTTFSKGKRRNTKSPAFELFGPALQDMDGGKGKGGRGQCQKSSQNKHRKFH